MAKSKSKDYSRYLTLYSGGADSTYFVLQEPSARHLIHYSGLNPEQTKVANVNALALDRYLTIVDGRGEGGAHDGEVSRVQTLYDTQMAINAAVRAVSFGMNGIVMCFNADDSGIHFDAVLQILRSVEPSFDILLPLRTMKAAKIRDLLRMKQPEIKYVSCMRSLACGECPKCRRGY